MTALAPVSAGDLAVYMTKTVVVMVVLGKRSRAQLNLYDLAMLIALSNSIQNSITGGRGNLQVGLAVATTVVVSAWALHRLLVRIPRLGRRVVGEPVILVRDGRPLTATIRHQQVTSDELSAAIRGHGLADVAEVALAVLEVDGSISVVPASPRGVPPGSL